MVTEIAYITINPDRDEEFIAAVGQAAPYFKEAEGCHGMRLERVVEDLAQFRLSVDWESIDHHMVTFRESHGFRQWRLLAGPFFVEPPRVEHWHRTGDFF